MTTPLGSLHDGPPTSNKFPQALSETVRRNLHSVGQSSRCVWPECSSSDSFMGLEAIEDHIVKAHVSAVQVAWPGCKWPDCESRKGAFSTASRLWDHIQNIHIEPLICPERDCSHKKAFGKQGDLDRHYKSKHFNGSLPFKCTRPLCPKPINGFARRDKLKEHVRNWHGAFECLIPGCHRGSGNCFRTQDQLDSHGQAGHRGLERGCQLSHCQTSNTFEASLDVLLADHIAAIHGYYNCELGTCGKNPASSFIPYTLKKHLIADHNVLPFEAVGLVDSLINAGECGLKDAQLARLGWTLSTRDVSEFGTSKTFVECKSCSLIGYSTSDSSE